jgi:altronate hydrolase
VKAALVISDRDNVATALEALEPGRRLDVNGRSITVAEPIAPGHKVALEPIAAGAAVIKYGSPIGTASSDIAVGAHVHTHNVAGGRGRGDLPAPSPAGEPRLAEPPEEGIPGEGGQSPF